MEPDHPIIILRLAGVFLCALPAVRELFQYINDPGCVRNWILFFSAMTFHFVVVQARGEDGNSRLVATGDYFDRIVDHHEVEQGPIY